MKQTTLTSIVVAIAAVAAVLVLGAIISAYHADAVMLRQRVGQPGEPGGPNGGGIGGTGASGAPGGLGGGQQPAQKRAD